MDPMEIIEAPMCGGWNGNSELSEEEYTMIVAMRPDVQAHLGAEFEHFNPLKIKKQVVAGINYWVKIQTGETTFVHAKIYKPLPHTQQPPELKEAHADKTLEDEL